MVGVADDSVLGIVAGGRVAIMVAEEMVDAAINYMNVIQERLSYYEGAKLHSLERLLNS